MILDAVMKPAEELARACKSNKHIGLMGGSLRGISTEKKYTSHTSLSGSNLGHIVVLAKPRQVRVEVLDSLLVRFEQLRPHSSRLGQLL